MRGQYRLHDQAFASVATPSKRDARQFTWQSFKLIAFTVCIFPVSFESWTRR